MRSLPLVVIILIFSSSLAAWGAKSQTAPQVIEAFYKSYLGQKSAPKRHQLTPPLSKTFAALIARNKDVCRRKAGSDICGWGADGDVYLDAQEVDPALSYASSGIAITESTPGRITVKLNVYPSMPAPEDAAKPGAAETRAYYTRTIGYQLVQFSGGWVVDDMYDGQGVSARKRIKDETEQFEAKKKK